MASGHRQPPSTQHHMGCGSTVAFGLRVSPLVHTQDACCVGSSHEHVARCQRRAVPLSLCTVSAVSLLVNTTGVLRHASLHGMVQNHAKCRGLYQSILASTRLHGPRLEKLLSRRRVWACWALPRRGARCAVR